MNITVPAVSSTSNQSVLPSGIESAELSDAADTIRSLNSISREQILHEPTLIQKIVNKASSEMRNKLHCQALEQNGQAYLNYCRAIAMYQQQVLETACNIKYKSLSVQMQKALTLQVYDFLSEVQKKMSVVQNSIIMEIQKDINLLSTITDKTLRNKARIAIDNQTDMLMDTFQSQLDQFCKSMDATIYGNSLLPMQ